MNWKKFSENVQNNIASLTISGILIVLFYLLCSHLPQIGAVIATVWNALMPFILGMFTAFILIPMRDVIEKKWLSHTGLSPRVKRWIGVAGSMIIFLLLLVGFFSIMIPQIVNSITNLLSNIDSYVETINKMLDGLKNVNPEAGKTISDLINQGLSAFKKWMTGAQGGLTQVVDLSIILVKNVINFIIGLFVAGYLLASEEKFKHQFKKIVFAFCHETVADGILHFMRLTAHMFNKFIFGKALDSLIIGIVTWIVLSIMRLPYAPLFALIVGVTNMIPIFGPFIGALPCLLILVLTSPWYALEFLIFIIILQQIDGNLLGPYILGDSLGLPALWTMFAIIVGGNLFGVVGMFLGVPIFAVFYTLIRDRADRKVREKRIKLEEK